jgi:hypothetical protein
MRYCAATSLIYLGDNEMIRRDVQDPDKKLEVEFMTHNRFVAGLATAIALSLTAAYAATYSGPSVKKNEFLQVAQVSSNPNSGRVYCYNGFKADQIDNWAPIYRGWICIPDNRH